MKQAAKKDNDVAVQLVLLEELYELRKSLIQKRQSMNMTQAELAAKAGLSQQQISRVETGNCNLSTFLKYVEGLDYKISMVPK